MPRYDERALVLDVAPFRESSSLVRVFTEHEGRISLVARGLRSSKNNSSAAAMQPFNVVRIRFSLKDGATLGNLTTAEIEQTAQAPHQSVEAYALISYWFEILKETSQERVTMAGVFQLTMQMLEIQHKAPGLTTDYLNALLILCRELGFGMSLNRCVECGQPPDISSAAPVYLSVPRGGIVCESCHQSQHVAALRLTRDEISAIAALAPDHPAPDKTDPATAGRFLVLTLVNRFLVNHLEHPLRSFRFIQDVIGKA